jgi:hypothetical protein
MQQALPSPVPAPRKPLPPRKSRLEPFKTLIRDMVQADQDDRRTVTSIMSTLVTDHGMTGISYSTVRGYVVSLRGNSQQPRRAAGNAVASALPQGPTRRTTATGGPCSATQSSVEHDGHVQAGGPLHADVTAFLLARGRRPAPPLQRHDRPRRGRDPRALAGRRDHAGRGSGC